MNNQIETYMRLLVGTDTTNPSGNEKKLTDQIINLAEDCCYERITHEPGRESLVLTIQGKNPDKVLAFAGHLDTVPIGNRNLWEHDPFGEIVGDIMYGRGTTDMCGGLTAMLLLLDYYKEEIPPVTIKLIFTADEEANSTGAKDILKDGLLKDINALIICKPTNLLLGISEKGTIWLRVCVKGVTSHASMPNEGKNALQIGMNFLNEVKEAIETLYSEHYLLGNNTCEITSCQSGIKINMIPNEAVFELDIRTLPTVDGGNRELLQIIDEIRKSCEYQYGVNITTDILGNREAIEEPETSEFITRIKSSIGDISNCSVKGIYYFTDGAIMVPKDRIPFVILGPGNPEQCHKVDEHISLKQIQQCYQLYQRVIDSFIMTV